MMHRKPPIAAQAPAYKKKTRFRVEGLGYRGYIGILGYILGLYGNNGKENGNYYNGLYEKKLGNLEPRVLGFGAWGLGFRV